MLKKIFAFGAALIVGAGLYLTPALAQEGEVCYSVADQAESIYSQDADAKFIMIKGEDARKFYDAILVVYNIPDVLGYKREDIEYFLIALDYLDGNQIASGIAGDLKDGSGRRDCMLASASVSPLDMARMEIVAGLKADDYPVVPRKVENMNEGNFNPGYAPSA